MKFPFALASALVLLLAVSSCEKHSTDHGDEHMVPAIFRLLLVSQTDTATATWSDLDGPGGNQPQTTTLQLRPGTYQGRLEIFTADGDTLTTVIRQQGTEHQLFYTPSSTLANIVTITIADRDARGMPLGLETSWEIKQVQAPISSSIRIQLYHYEPNTKDGQSPSTETDADISVPVKVVVP